MKRLYYILALVVTLSFSACIDEIDLNIDTDRQFVIVNGLISDVFKTHQVKLDYSPIIGVGNDNIFTPITGATVSVSGSDGSNVRFVANDESEGVYEAEMATTPGVSYTLNVSTPDGQNITSTPTVAPQSTIGIDSLDFAISKEERFNNEGFLITTEFVNVLADLNLTGAQRPFLRWRATGEYQFQEDARFLLNPKTCYVKESIDFNNLPILNTQEVATDRVDDLQILTTLLNERFLITYLFNVFQYTVTEDELKYWEKVEELVNIDGTLFDPPPGAIVGNLNAENDDEARVQGYFSVVAEVSDRLFVDVAQKGGFAITTCTRGFMQENPAKCDDCLTINNSSLVRPPYWNP